MPSPEIAIVGSGPSGFFAAQSILKADACAKIHMFDRLPTPYGLVRSGVAPDHQTIKQVTRVFEAISRSPNFTFLGNVEIERDVTLHALRQRYDVVIMATGASEGIPLSIGGAKLPQSLTAAEFVGWYNGHPDFADLQPKFDHETAVIIGHGNVAIDIARVLLSDQTRLEKTDIADHALETLKQSKIRNVHLVGRRGPAQTSFTSVELRELLMGLADVHVLIEPKTLQLDRQDDAEPGPLKNSAALRNVKLMHEASTQVYHGQKRTLHLTFLASPVSIHGSDRVSGVEFVRNRLVVSSGAMKAVSTSEQFLVPAGLVVSSIGFKGRPVADLASDETTGILSNIEGRVEGMFLDGLAPVYAVGWVKRGCNGVIGTNKACAEQTVQNVFSDFQDGKWRVLPDFDRRPLSLKNASVDMIGWRRIDDVECKLGAETGRPRKKIVSIDAMLEIAAVGP